MDTQKWSPHSTKLLNTYIKESGAVHFEAVKKIDDTTFVGILSYRLNASKLLLSANEATKRKPSSIAFLAHIIELNENIFTTGNDNSDIVNEAETETESFLGEGL